MNLTAVELFSGGGGLAVGLKRAGVHPRVAVELEPHAAQTFRANHPDVFLIEDDVRRIKGASIRKAINNENVDILAACPPCQGFSSLTSKYHKYDNRNELVFEVSRLVRSVKPKALMFENVPGLASRGKTLFDLFMKRLCQSGYICNWGILEVADYGVPQRRKRLVLLAGKGFHIDLPTPTHSQHGRSGLPRWRSVQDTISHLGEAMIFAQSKAVGGPHTANWHIIRTMSDANFSRLRLAKAGGTWRDLPESVRPPCHQNGYKGFMNAYGRLEWGKPSATITSGCTSLSKGRFGHPESDRTISVREAALLQTFPHDYVFDTPLMDKACEIIGNALPCYFAEAIAAQVARTIRRVAPWLNP